jgi:hypothetical protein
MWQRLRRRKNPYPLGLVRYEDWQLCSHHFAFLVVLALQCCCPCSYPSSSESNMSTLVPWWHSRRYLRYQKVTGVYDQFTFDWCTRLARIHSVGLSYDVKDISASGPPYVQQELEKHCKVSKARYLGTWAILGKEHCLWMGPRKCSMDLLGPANWRI